MYGSNLISSGKMQLLLLTFASADHCNEEKTSQQHLLRRLIWTHTQAQTCFGLSLQRGDMVKVNEPIYFTISFHSRFVSERSFCRSSWNKGVGVVSQPESHFRGQHWRGNQHHHSAPTVGGNSRGTNFVERSWFNHPEIERSLTQLFWWAE